MADARQRSTIPKLFTPLRVGKISLSHRVVMSPLTRGRSPAGIPTDLSAEYYGQRASPGGLIISEGTHPSLMGGNYYNVPSIYSPEHIRAWKTVTDAVHAKGGYMFCQLWHTGRVTVAANLGGRKPLGPSRTKLDFIQRFTPVGPLPCEEPEEMTLEDVRNTIADHVHAANCAMQAGFDGVEVQGANGYLLDQFLCPNINHRTDSYGGNPTNRARLIIELLQALITTIGADRTAIRLSPFGVFQNPLGHPDPVGTYTELLNQVDKLGLAYVCLLEPRSDMFLPADQRLKLLYDAATARGLAPHQLKHEISLRPFRQALRETVMFASGGFNSSNCFSPVEDGEVDGVVFGKTFISNPDLLARLRNSWPLAPYDRKTFYTPGPKGYVDYPAWDADMQSKQSPVIQRL